jgi:hypothetical protein
MIYDEGGSKRRLAGATWVGKRASGKLTIVCNIEWFEACEFNGGKEAGVIFVVLAGYDPRKALLGPDAGVGFR